MYHQPSIRILATLLLGMCVGLSFGQQAISGSVSFVTSQNIYVRFSDASNINIGDTLKVSKDGRLTPCLVVISKSSTSCVSQSINGCNPAKGTPITAYVKTKKKQKKEKSGTTEKPIQSAISQKADSSLQDTDDESEDSAKKTLLKRVNGRFSLANYASRDDVGSKNRAMGRLALDVDKEGAAGLSFESYMNYTQLSTSREVSSDFQNSRFNIFNLALGYEKDSSYSVFLGRRINNQMASIGATDGLQAEKKFGALAVGALAGFRPNVFNYGLDFNLPQLGGYLALRKGNKSFQSQSTLGFIEQRNGGATDRRYAYLQHSISFKKLYFFGSTQLDLYQKMNGVAQSDFKLSGLFLSARYRVGKRLSLMTSYDTRRNLIFYESYANSVDFLTQNNPKRQGIRARANYRLGKFISTGASYHIRFQSDKANPFTNYSVHLRHSKVPAIGGGFYVSYNLSENSSLSYSSAMADYRKSFFKNKVTINTYYRLVQYQYNIGDFAVPNQHYYGGGLNYRFTKRTSLSVFAEQSQRASYKSERLNLKLIQRF